MMDRFLWFIENYSKYSIYIFFILSFTFGLIGPVLSFYSLMEELKFTYEKALIYSIATFIADFISVIIVSFLFFKITNYKNYNYWLLFYSLIYTIIWGSDIFDISQYLRVFSNLGLILSILILFYILKEKFKNKVYILLAIHIIFYILDAFISELIATNPLILKILKH